MLLAIIATRCGLDFIPLKRVLLTKPVLLCRKHDPIVDFFVGEVAIDYHCNKQPCDTCYKTLKVTNS